MLVTPPGARHRVGDCRSPEASEGDKQRRRDRRRRSVVIRLYQETRRVRPGQPRLTSISGGYRAGIVAGTLDEPRKLEWSGRVKRAGPCGTLSGWEAGDLDVLRDRAPRLLLSQHQRHLSASAAPPRAACPTRAVVFRIPTDTTWLPCPVNSVGVSRSINEDRSTPLAYCHPVLLTTWVWRGA